MAKIAAGFAIAVLAFLALTQIFIPPLASEQVENRLTDKGGTAHVTLKAWPALTLLWGHGRKFEATGKGVEIDLQNKNKDPLGKLDKFDEVRVRIINLRAGPVAVRTFGLEKRKGDSSYYLRLDATTTPAEMARQAGQQFGGTLGNLLGGLAGTVLPGSGDTEIPIDVEGQLTRKPGGGVDVDSVRASVAGLPAGPFAEVIVQSVVDQL
jgi:hypothetical protein